MGLKNETVYLESNYEEWKKMYEEEKNKLIKLFNNDNLIIEHVGSTSIKGLLSKPIVDIAVGVNNIDDLNKYLEKLNKIYTVKVNNESEEILLIKENNIETFYLIHVLNINSNRFKNMIKFRDILNNNEDILKEYEKLKQNLSLTYSNDRKMYTKSKNEFINEILKKY